MDNQFLAAPRRARNRVIIVAVAVVAAFGAGLVVRMIPDHHAAHRALPAPRVTPAASVPDPIETVPGTPGAVPSASPAAGPLQLVASSRTTDGVPLGYPHTVAGVVSACVEWVTLITSNLDLQRAIDIGTLITDPADGSPAHFANGPISVRKILGVPTSGPVPLGASVVSSPVGYQVRGVTAGSVTVLVLAFYTLHSDSYGYRSYIAVFPVLMVWAGDDWKYRERPANASDYAELRLEPGSPEAAAAGWLDFVQ